ncbi:hypothetical protein EV356DRAFT_37716 [Viridothelium virens]|uniref:Uncharacterized protein n=1 Tax=Viridothelium virens TaxID=1048519 RepID=A0A6A6HFL1_VIRVR|nr:hypothetical protein EV356DRAFT_37716 [Viridothelium virens]
MSYCGTLKLPLRAGQTLHSICKPFSALILLLGPAGESSGRSVGSAEQFQEDNEKKADLQISICVQHELSPTPLLFGRYFQLLFALIV